MENWRGYLAENQQASYHDNLYLFENDTIKKTSFNDALDVLTESDDDIEAFLENWEKSIDYELQQLNEGIVGDFIFNASVKVYIVVVLVSLDTNINIVWKISDCLHSLG